MISEPLANIINLSSEKVIYIEISKISATIPVYKDKGMFFVCVNSRVLLPWLM